MPAQVGRGVLLLTAGVWVMVLNNSRITQNPLADGAYAWLSVPRAARAVEAVLVLSAFAVLQPRLVRSRQGTLNGLLWLFIGASGVAAWLAPSLLLAQFQGIYIYLAPFLVFLIAWEASPTPRLIRWLCGWFSACLALSIVALFFQFSAVGAKGDWIHGFFSDAHVLGSFLAIGSCAAFSTFLEQGGTGYGLGAGALFLLSYFPANEKVVLLNAVWFATALSWRWLRHPRGWRTWSALAVATVAALAFVTGRPTDAEPLLRLNLIEGRSLSNLGPVRAWSYTWDAIADSPVTFAVGLGPANYAGLAAAQAVHGQSTVLDLRSKTATEVLLEEPDLVVGAVAWVRNSWSSLLAEFGFVGFGVFGAALGCVVLPIWRWKPPGPFEWRARTVFFAMLAVVVAQGAVSPYTNWAEPVLAYPMMVAAAYCHRVLHPAGTGASAT